MATVTLTTLLTRIREDLGIEQAGEVLTDVELTARINWAANALYNRLVRLEEDYYTTSYSFTLTTSNVHTMSPAPYKVRALDFAVDTTTDRYTEVAPYSFAHRNGVPWRSFRVIAGTIKIMPFSVAPGTYRLWYVPAYTTLVSGSDTFDAISGFDRLIVAKVCAWGRTKQELDPSIYLAEVKSLEAEIDAYARARTSLGVRSIQDVRARWGRGPVVSTDYDLPGL